MRFKWIPMGSYGVLMTFYRGVSWMLMDFNWSWMNFNECQPWNWDDGTQWPIFLPMSWNHQSVYFGSNGGHPLNNLLSLTDRISNWTLVNAPPALEIFGTWGISWMVAIFQCFLFKFFVLVVAHHWSGVCLAFVHWISWIVFWVEHIWTSNSMVKVSNLVVRSLLWSAHHCPRITLGKMYLDLSLYPLVI